MSKKFIFIYIIILLSIIFITKAEEESGKNDEEFQKYLKQYLIDKNLFDSEEPVKPEEMKKIFIDVITEGEYESNKEFYEGIFNELADYFVNSYYVNRKEIKGKQIYDLIDINQIYEKYELMMSYYSEASDDEENIEPISVEPTTDMGVIVNLR